jgi:SET domain-containing protein
MSPLSFRSYKYLRIKIRIKKNKIIMDLKEKLIIKRLEKVYCKLAPSQIHGIGVFAIKDIPKGTNPFNNSFMAQEAIIVNKNKLGNLGSEILSLLHDYHPTSDPDKQIVSNFPNQPIWSNYINYTDEKHPEPNIELLTNGEWCTLCDIRKGEELIEDPKRLLNLDGSQKIFKIGPKQYPLLNF